MTPASPVARFATAVSLEVATVFGPHDDKLVDSLGLAINFRLTSKLKRVRSVPESARTEWLSIRQELTPEISKSISEILRKARASYSRGSALPVTYAVDGQKWVGAFDFSQVPFIRYHHDALEAAEVLRRESCGVQLRALKAARSGHDFHGIASSGTVRGVAPAIALPLEAARALNTFVDALSFDTTVGHCVPISFEPSASSEDLLMVANAYGELGQLMRFPFEARLGGKRHDRADAEREWANYEQCGVAMRLVAGWVRCLAMNESRARCDICYRHTASRHRCGVHATKTHETREGRLGKRVMPYYLQLARDLMSHPQRRRALNGYLTPPLGDAARLKQFAEEHVVEENILVRAVSLAESLRALYPLIRPSRVPQAQQIFLGLITNAREASTALPGRTLSEIAQRRAARAQTLEDVSLKGFCKAWFGKPSSSGALSTIAPLGLDPRHPALDGGIDPLVLTRSLALQWAWEDSEEAYIRRAMPTAEIIEPLLADGWSYEQIARHLQLSHQSVRTSVRRSNSARARNRLPV